MIGRVWWVGAVVLAVLGLTVGCGSDRPQDVALDDVKPCDLISSSNLSALQVAAQPQSLDGIAGADEEVISCSYRQRNGTPVYVGAVTNHGVDRWTNGSQESSMPTDLPRIQGYRTIKVELRDFPSGPHDTCTLYVDVAGDQSLKVEVRGNSENDPPTCETAHRFAKSAMASLTA